MIKSFTTVLFVIIYLCIYTFTGFAQSADYDEKIWSIVKIDREKADNIKRDDYWVPAEQVTRFFDFATGITVEPNIRVKPGNTTQSELSIDVHPTNSNIVFGSANATNWNPLTTLYGTGVYWSLSGSTSWTGYDNPPFGTNSGDPVSVIGPDGRFYENYITNAYGLGVAVSTNNGANWTTHSVAPNPGQLTDKNHYMIDKTVGSPFENRSYCIWTDFGGSNDGDAVLRYSTNFGQTWSASINLSNALSAFNQGVNVQTGPNGEVYATWAVYTGSFGSEDGIAFTKSVNGGVSWSTPVYAYFSTNFGIRGSLSSKNGIRVSSFPSMAVDRSGGPNNGNIYISWPQRGVSPAGSDPDIILIKSTNGGTTWSSPVRVNDDPLNNGKDQYYSWCTVDQSTGQLMLVFYDSRNVPNNQAEVYMARSLDGGNTFENFQVSDQPHTPQPISGLAGGYAGDYIGVAALDNVAYPFWSDNRLGSDHYQAWTALVTFGPPCPVDPPSNPNPLNADTDISVNLPQLSWTNSAGASQCEVWFGRSGSVTKVYDGSVISSWTIPYTLEYTTLYNWHIIDKNDTCGTSGSNWSFTTELSPGIVFVENFNNLNCWSQIGPLGTTNWSTQSSANAGGTTPELTLSWTPEFNGLSKLRSCAISVLNNRHYTVSLKHMLDWYANPAPTLGLGVSYDNGATYNSIWSFTPTGNVGSETIEASFITPASDSPDAINLYLVLYCDGNSYNIDYWYVDDIILNDDDYFDVADPSNVSATAINDSQIDVVFTPNIDNDNVVLVWNTSGSFSVPSGPPPAIGQPFAGGTLLYNGTTSPVIHGDLNTLTTYYYKAFSYDNVNYSPGIEVNATTLATQAAIDIPITISNNVGTTSDIYFGLDPSATDGVDPALGEASLPGFPPSGYAAVWLFPDFTTISYRDYRNAPSFPYSGQVSYLIKIQNDLTSNPMTVSWDLPSTIAATGTIGAGADIVSFSGTGSHSWNYNPVNLQFIFVEVDFDTVTTFSYSVDVLTGWNLVSAPGTNPAGMGVEDWWPNNINAYVFSFDGVQYQQQTVAAPGEGYWMNNSGAETYNYPSIGIVAHDPIPVTTGWNIIGGYETSPTIDVLKAANLQISGLVYGFDGVQYIEATNLLPGYGYWVFVTTTDPIVIPSALTKGSGEVVELFKEDWGRITLTDAEGKSYTLYAVKGEVDLNQYNMPPLPPSGSFDIRFSSGRIAEDINSSMQTIDMTGVTYPLTVRVDGMDIRLQDALGSVVNVSLKSGEDVVIGEATVQKLMVTGEVIPTVYALEQNYPNPFNPSTVIEFSLPEDVSNVKLSIYNTLGEKVAEIVNSSLTAGKYQYQWNAQNVATGMYIYELRTNNFVSVQKMLLLK